MLISITLGVAFSIGLWWWGLWLAPPWLAHTVWLHCAPLWLWLPVLVVVLARMRLRGCAILVVIAISYGLLSALCWMTLVGPTFGPLAGYSTLQCSQAALASGQVRYICISASFSTSTTYVLEGPAGWPIAWVKTVTTR
jgi:hypothetical protein